MFLPSYYNQRNHINIQMVHLYLQHLTIHAAAPFQTPAMKSWRSPWRPQPQGTLRLSHNFSLGNASRNGRIFHCLSWRMGRFWYTLSSGKKAKQRTPLSHDLSVVSKNVVWVASGHFYLRMITKMDRIWYYIYIYIYIQCVYVSVYCFDCLKPRILVFQVRGLLASLLFVTLEICWRRIPSESEQASNIRLVAVVPRFCPFHHRYVTLGHCSLAILHYCYYFCLVVPF